MDAKELTQRLNKAVTTLLNLSIDSSDPTMSQRLLDKRDAVEEGLALWFRLYNSQPRKDTVDLVIEMETEMKTRQEVSSGGTREGYGLVLSYLREIVL